MMKKITLFLLAFILLITNVDAKEIIKGDKKGEYIRKDIVSEKYEHVDEDDIQYGEYSEYTAYDDSLTLDSSYLDYDIKDVISYYKSYDIDYVQIKAEFGDIKYKSMAISYDGNSVGYQIVKEVDSNSETKTINNYGYIMLKLERSIPADEKISVTMEIEPMDDPRFNVIMYNANNMSKPILKSTVNGENPTTFVDPEWGQYMFDRTKKYYSEESPVGGRLYYLIGYRSCYRYREIFTYRYNIISTDDDKTDNAEVQESNSDNAMATPVSDGDSLVNLEDYQSIEVPNTYKTNIWLILSNLLFGSF